MEIPDESNFVSFKNIEILQSKNDDHSKNDLLEKAIEIEIFEKNTQNKSLLRIANYSFEKD